MRKSFVKSLLEFNERVLYYGNPRHNKIDPLFFNQIFMSNTDEMFEKYDMSSVMDDYLSDLSQCISNIGMIIGGSQINLALGDDSTFEEHFVVSRAIGGKMISSPLDRNFLFRSEFIYYLCRTNAERIICCYVDPRMSVYNEPLSVKIGNDVVYWKTDRAIASYLQSIGYSEVLPIRVTLEKGSNRVTKIEYNGTKEVLRYFDSVLPASAAFVQNPCLYTGDIEQMLTKPTKEEEQKYRRIEALDLIDQDELIEYPNDSFNDYLWFLRSAIANQETAEIYLTLYRIGTDPTIYYLLRRAVSLGIRVFVNVELYASGEEEVNSLWANELRAAGVNVTSFAAGKLKVHSKITLVKFNNGRSIVQIGTGNYHTKTTMQYTDLSLMTGDEDICHQAEKLFKLINDNRKVSFNNNMLVTLFNARQRLAELIDNEAHDKGYICFKCNSLDDDEIIKHLERAAKRGCEMDLIVRGVCTWIPESKRVRIKSCIWDKLEHSRVYLFGRRNPTVYIGSLDLITHKIDRRIETLVRIKSPDIIIQVCDYLNRYVGNVSNSWAMNSEGIYYKIKEV